MFASELTGCVPVWTDRDPSKFLCGDGSFVTLPEATGGTQWSPVPASSLGAGTPGDMARDEDYLYLCYLQDRWGRFAIDKTAFGITTAYSNYGGQGDRTGIITVSFSGTKVGDPNTLVNGASANVFYWATGANSSGVQLTFNFGSVAVVIDEARFLQSNTSSHGGWKWQGSNDGAVWSDIGGEFTLGGSADQTISALAGNTNAYKQYRIVSVSGSRTSNPYLYEFLFKTFRP